MSERFGYHSVEVFRIHQKPADTMSGAATPEKDTEALRHMTPYGELSFDPQSGIAVSPLLPLGHREISFLRANPGRRSDHITNDGKLLEALLRNPTRVHSYDSLLEVLWGKLNFRPFPNVARNNAVCSMQKLRKKLGEVEIRGDNANPKKTLIRGIPYRGYTLLTPEKALEVDHELSYRHTTPLGELKYNHEALLASSPLVEDGNKPIDLTAQEGEILRALIMREGGALPMYALVENFKSIGNVRLLLYNLRNKLGDVNISGNNSRPIYQLVEKTSHGYRLTSA